MNRLPIIRPWNRNDSSKRYDAFIAVVGYESRARYIAETINPIANEKIACAFSDRKVHHYQENHDWFLESGYKVEEITDKEFRNWWKIKLEGIRSSKLTWQSICVDVSSLNRFRIAVLIDTLRRLNWEATIQVDFVYSLAEFSPPPQETAPNTHVGPVLDSFAGWTSEPDRPPVAIVGLGYEQEKALGAVEHIQAAEVWVFMPASPIASYTGALERANRTLLESIPTGRRLTYFVDRPLDSFAMLESLTHRIVQSNSPVLFPFGPKIFTVYSLLVACLYPSAAVWRVSAGQGGEAIDRVPSGHIYGLEVEFIPEIKRVKGEFSEKAALTYF